VASSDRLVPVQVDKRCGALDFKKIGRLRLACTDSFK
jgi:hypothetical protein